MESPKRAYNIEITVTADTWERLVADLEELLVHVSARGPQCDCIRGGCSSSSSVEVRHDPTMSNEKYFEQMKSYLSAQKAELVKISDYPQAW